MGNLSRFALMIGATALFAGCGGSQPPIGTPGAMAQSSAAHGSKTFDYTGSAQFLRCRAV